MVIIAGLGNPGSKYEKTRHNCGFEVIDMLAERFQIDVSTRRFKALTGIGQIRGNKVLLMKPQTFMNLSGEAIQPACAFYKADPKTSLIVISDDVNLPPGQLRIRGKGSAGGHNGMKSIITCLGTEEFIRIRVGVGMEPPGFDLADFVLGRFSHAQKSLMTDAFERASCAVEDLLTQKLDIVMNQYNRKVVEEE